jgi:hypothetical protein
MYYSVIASSYAEALLQLRVGQNFTPLLMISFSLLDNGPLAVLTIMGYLSSLIGISLGHELLLALLNVIGG